MCLGIIANAPGEERPGIKTFLETGTRGILVRTKISEVADGTET